MPPKVKAKSKGKAKAKAGGEDSVSDSDYDPQMDSSPNPSPRAGVADADDGPDSAPMSPRGGAQNISRPGSPQVVMMASRDIAKEGKIEIVRAPKTPEHIKQRTDKKKIHARYLDVDYSPGKRETQNKQWQIQFMHDLRTGVTESDPLFPVPLSKEGRSKFYSPTRFGVPKWIPNHATMSLNKLMEQNLEQYKHWLQLHGDAMTTTEDKIVKGMMTILDSKITQLEFEPADASERQPRRLPPMIPHKDMLGEGDGRFYLSKPSRRMDVKTNERIRRGLTETFTFYARSNVDYDLHAPPIWVSAAQWEMFCKGFQLVRFDFKLEDLHTIYGPTKEPIDFGYFVELLSNLSRRFLENLHGAKIEEQNYFNEEPRALALYRFTELLGFHDEKCSYRKFLRGREKFRLKSKPDGAPGSPGHQSPRRPNVRKKTAERNFYRRNYGGSKISNKHYLTSSADDSPPGSPRGRKGAVSTEDDEGGEDLKMLKVKQAAGGEEEGN